VKQVASSADVWENLIVSFCKALIRWLVAVGHRYWLLAIGYWLLAIGYWLLAMRQLNEFYRNRLRARQF
jgi:hypothetical protein